MALDLTVDEIVETLKRSSLTSIIVEGKDDVMIYRWIEDEIGVDKANFFPCGGRDKLLQVYQRRNEFSQITSIFIADRDAYVYINPPHNYNDILWTTGYSIENDLYYGRRIESLLSPIEKAIHLKSLNNFIEYYAFEVDKCVDGEEYCFNLHPQQVLDLQNEVKEEFLESINFLPAKDETIIYLRENYDVLIRGKTLFALLTRILSDSKRHIKHSKLSLLEHCYRTHVSEKFVDLINQIKIKISYK